MIRATPRNARFQPAPNSTSTRSGAAPFVSEGAVFSCSSLRSSGGFCVFSVRLSFLLVLAILSLSACGPKSPTNTAPNLKSLFPDSAAVAPNWSRSDDIRTYPPAQLSDYIDGDAEKYLRVNVLATSTADYKFQGKFDAVADIYTFSEPAGAKAIFDSEPSAGAATPQVGDSARLYEQSLIYRKGRYLVRIVAYQATPQLQQGLLDLGKSIEARLIP
jgi:predicted small lipoprotein YifL